MQIRAMDRRRSPSDLLSNDVADCEPSPCREDAVPTSCAGWQLALLNKRGMPCWPDMRAHSGRQTFEVLSRQHFQRHSQVSFRPAAYGLNTAKAGGLVLQIFSSIYVDSPARSRIDVFSFFVREPRMFHQFGLERARSRKLIFPCH
jgi:hypothetical protein